MQEMSQAPFGIHGISKEQFAKKIQEIERQEAIHNNDQEPLISKGMTLKNLLTREKTDSGGVYSNNW